MTVAHRAADADRFGDGARVRPRGRAGARRRPRQRAAVVDRVRPVDQDRRLVPVVQRRPADGEDPDQVAGRHGAASRGPSSRRPPGSTSTTSCRAGARTAFTTWCRAGRATSPSRFAPKRHKLCATRWKSAQRFDSFAPTDQGTGAVYSGMRDRPRGFAAICEQIECRREGRERGRADLVRMSTRCRRRFDPPVRDRRRRATRPGCAGRARCAGTADARSDRDADRRHGPAQRGVAAAHGTSPQPVRRRRAGGLPARDGDLRPPRGDARPRASGANGYTPSPNTKRWRCADQRQELVASEDIDFDRHEARNEPSPDERIVSYDQLTRSAEALQRLKPNEMRALWLKASGQPYSAIAEAQGWTLHQG